MTIKRYDLNELKGSKLKTDIKRIKKIMKENKIDFSDLPETTVAEFATAKRGKPKIIETK